MRSEDLGPTLHVRASWEDIWFQSIRREEYPIGAGLVRSTFEIGRSEPTSEEQQWVPLTTLDDSNNYVGSCGVTYNQVQVGFKEKTFKPCVFGLLGPLLCQDDFTVNWNSIAFWEKYFQAIEKNNAKSLMHRRRNVFMEYVPKASCRSSFAFVDGNVSGQPPLSTQPNVDLSAVSAPTSDLTQEYLDTTAQLLMQAGATNPDSNGWINLGPMGPEFPLLAGTEVCKRLWQNNSDLREDARFAFENRGDLHPLLMRLGATHVLGNFRHIPTLFPPRWRYANGAYTRVPAFTMSNAGGNATKGYVAIVNPNYVDPTYANVEGAIVLSPWVYTEQPLRPVNSAPGTKFNVQNYMGDWDFVTGIDALSGFPDCPNPPQDPKHKMGRHIAEYRAAYEPVFPDHGRLILFSRCPATYTQVTCS